MEEPTPVIVEPIAKVKKSLSEAKRKQLSEARDNKKQKKVIVPEPDSDYSSEEDAPV